MGLEKRIADLERLYASSTAPYEDTPEGAALREADLEARREKFKRLLAIGEEKAAAEEAQGDNRRRLAIEELKQHIKRRREEFPEA